MGGGEGFGEGIAALREYLVRTERLIALASPTRNLKLGYSITLSGGKVVKSKKDVKIGDNLETRLSDGAVASIVK